MLRSALLVILLGVCSSQRPYVPDLGTYAWHAESIAALPQIIDRHFNRALQWQYGFNQVRCAAGLRAYRSVFRLTMVAPG